MFFEKCRVVRAGWMLGIAEINWKGGKDRYVYF
jgi:hypothetical protein